MIDDATKALDELVRSLRDTPTALPMQQLLALHAQQSDVRISLSEECVVAIVEPRRDPAFSRLTPRENHVAELVAAGNTNRQIAQELSLALSTVKDHVHAILSKTGFESRSRLIAAWYGGPSQRSAHPA